MALLLNRVARPIMRRVHIVVLALVPSSIESIHRVGVLIVHSHLCVSETPIEGHVMLKSVSHHCCSTWILAIACGAVTSRRCLLLDSVLVWSIVSIRLLHLLELGAFECSALALDLVLHLHVAGLVVLGDAGRSERLILGVAIVLISGWCCLTSPGNLNTIQGWICLADHGHEIRQLLVLLIADLLLLALSHDYVRRDVLIVVHSVLHWWHCLKHAHVEWCTGSRVDWMRLGETAARLPSLVHHQMNFVSRVGHL